jgi:hypothetical protein
MTVQPDRTAAGGPAVAARASATSSECRNGGSVKAKFGSTVRRTSSHQEVFGELLR